MRLFNPSLLVRSLTVACGCLLMMLANGRAAAPVNDNYAAAIVIPSALPSTTGGSTVEATLESGEPSISSQQGTVWYRWTVPASAYVELNAVSTELDTVLTVFTATPSLPTNSDRLQQNDDAELHITNSRIRMAVDAGQQLAIRVGGYGAVAGTFTLSMTVLPTPYDTFAGRNVLASEPIFSGRFTNGGATLEAGEPVTVSQVQATVWFSWTAPTTAQYRIDTRSGPSLDTVLAVYSGTAGLPAAGQLLVSNDDFAPDLMSEVLLNAVAGNTYSIQVGTFNTARGAFVLSIDGPRPANDFFRTRITVSGALPINVPANNTYASREEGEGNAVLPGGSGSLQGSLWYSWTAPTTDYYQFDTQTVPNIDTVMAVYPTPASGNVPPTQASMIDSNDDTNGRGSRVIVRTVAGQSYTIQVGGFNSARGAFTFVISLAQPPNNNFSAAISAGNADTVHLSGWNERATLEAGEPSAFPSMQGSIWYSWTARVTGTCTVDTAGSAVDTILSVYASAASLGGLAAPLASNNDASGLGTASRVTFPAVAGTTYLIQAGSFTAARGAVLVNINLVPSAADIALYDSDGNAIFTGHPYYGVGAQGVLTRTRITVKNEGGFDLGGFNVSLSGPQAAAFTFEALPATIPGNSQATLTLLFQPLTTVPHTATLVLTSNDGDEGTITIPLEFEVLSAADDSDGDGLNDVAEFQMAALGFDWLDSQPDLVAALQAGAGSAGLYSADQIQALQTGVNIARNPANGKFQLRLKLKKSTNLATWTDFPFVPAGTSVDGTGQVLFEFTAPDNAAFYKLEAK